MSQKPFRAFQGCTRALLASSNPSPYSPEPDSYTR
jgi:hypothetical protein